MFIIRNIHTAEFQDLLKKNDCGIKEKLSKPICDKNETTNSIIDCPQYKILELNIKKLWVRINEEKFLIFINVNSINSMQKKDFESFFENIKPKIMHNNKILINGKLEVIDEEYYHYDLNFKAQEVSRSNKVAFYMDSSGVTVYSEGKNIKTSIFYQDKDFIDYSSRKPITELKKVLDDYRDEYLIRLGHKFFEEKAIIEEYNLNKYTLISDINTALKDDLKDYLNKHLQYTFTKNGPLQGCGSKIDIYTIAEDKLYFITVEWLGCNISECKTKLESMHDDKCIEGAIKRTLEYINILMNNKPKEVEKGVEKAYLTLFDAREVKEEIDYDKHLNSVCEEYNSIIKYFEIVEKFNLYNTVVA